MTAKHEVHARRLSGTAEQIRRLEASVKDARQELSLACREAKKAGLSLPEIAKEIGVTPQRVSNMLAELRVRPPR